jgi:hypothetical protein
MSDVTFLVPKSTGTHGDVLAAAGLADLLAALPAAGTVMIVETERGFAVSAPRVLDLQSVPQHPGYPFMKLKPNAAVPAGVTDVVDYQAEWAKAERYKEFRNGARKPRRLDTQTEQAIQEEAPREDWTLLRVLRALQGHKTSNRVHIAIVGQPLGHWQAEIASALASFRVSEPSGLDWKARSVQLFTPTAAKGYSLLKPEGTGRNNNTKEEWVDHLVEWLRYRGYFRIACPFFRSSDVRVLCPVPAEISIRALESLARELRRSGIPGAPPKLDALAVLRIADLLVRHSEEYHDPDGEPWPGLSLAGKSPASAVSGVMVTHYQSLGQSRAVSAMSTLALPGWFTIRDRLDAEAWRAILAEHQRIVRGLRDDRSDEIGLLLMYRRFLECRGEWALSALLEFVEGYGQLVMRTNGTTRQGMRRWVTRFTAEHVRRIVMGINEGLATIIDDPGFQAVARAVRQATVMAQNRRARGGDVWREIRYELLHNLHRTRKVPGNAFLECVSEFTSRYNYENARHRETTRNPKAAPGNVSDEEFRSFVALVDGHGAPLIGALLAAYGTCKEKWEGDDVTPAGEAGNPSN